MSHTLNVVDDKIDVRVDMTVFESLGMNDLNDIIDEICLN